MAIPVYRNTSSVFKDSAMNLVTLVIQIIINISESFQMNICRIMVTTLNEQLTQRKYSM